jgi:hypothetical protein
MRARVYLRTVPRTAGEAGNPPDLLGLHSLKADAFSVALFPLHTSNIDFTLLWVLLQSTSI